MKLSELQPELIFPGREALLLPDYIRDISLSFKQWNTGNPEDGTRAEVFQKSCTSTPYNLYICNFIHLFLKLEMDSKIRNRF